jgi:hypothetical protein
MWPYLIIEHVQVESGRESEREREERHGVDEESL